MSLEPSGPDPVALADQAVAEVKQSARVVAAYFAALLAEDVDWWDALKLTLAFQRRLIFGAAAAGEPDDADDET